MAHLSIDEQKKICHFSNNWFSYNYYLDLETNKVYLEFDIYFDAKYIYRYSIKKRRGEWLLVVEEQVRNECGECLFIPRVRFAGKNKGTAIKHMIAKILEKPTKHEYFEANVPELEAKLRSVLKRYSSNV